MEAVARFFSLDWLSRRIAANDPKSQQFDRFRGRVKKNHFRQKDNYRFSELRFVVLDIETTGFKPQDGDEVISVGAVVVKGGIIKDERFDRLVNPHRVIPPIITELTGISDDMVCNADDFCTVMVDFLEFLGDSIIVGHCVDFDINFLNYKLKPYNITINNYYLDTITLAKIFHPELRRQTLDELVKYLGMDPSGRHTAMGDALMTAEIFIKYLQKLEKLKIKSLWDLRAFIRHSMLYIS